MSEIVEVKIHCADGAVLPKYETDHASGMDVCSIETITIYPGDTTKVRTGLFVEIPIGYEIQARPRSGMSFKTKLRVSNSPGTIDADYRGEICILFDNNGNEEIKINKGDRIAQIVLQRSPQISWRECSKEDLSDTKRGEGGFGHTGKQ